MEQNHQFFCLYMETRNKNNKVNKKSLLELAAERWADIVLQQIAYRKENKDQISYENKNYGQLKE